MPPPRIESRAAAIAAPARMVAVTACSGTAPPAVANHMLGPQRGHAIVCAWKRRDVGSRYSAAQAGHIAKARIAVASRS